MGYIFISYSSKNKIAADHFKRILTQNGIQSWMAPGDIPLARKYAEVINQAIRDCSGLMLLFSEPAQNSVWVAKEVERAISYHKPLLPVMLEEVTLNDEFELYISNEQGIMVNQLDENSPEIQKILSILREIVKADGGGDATRKFVVEPTSDVIKRVEEARLEEQTQRRKAKRKRVITGVLAGLLALCVVTGGFFWAGTQPHPAEKNDFAMAEDNVPTNEALHNPAADPQHDDGGNDDAKAATLNNEKADLSDAEAMFNLGVDYANGNFNGGVPDYVQAEIWYHRAADLGHDIAMFNLGFGYAEGYFNNGVPDYDRAKTWYERAADLGIAEAMFNLGHGYANGYLNNGVPDYDRAKAWYERAAELSNPEAISNLGHGYAVGYFNHGVPDRDRAKELYERAAELSNPWAMNNLAHGYEEGYFNNGVPDYERAKELYERAADLGVAVAMNNLGRGYEGGYFNNGVPDYERAIVWFQRGADLGTVESMYELGYIYTYKQKDYEAAEYWLNLARDAGYAAAADLLLLLEMLQQEAAE